MKKLTVCFTKGNDRIGKSIMCEGKDGTWYPVVYFRKSKWSSEEEYECILEEIRTCFTPTIKRYPEPLPTSTKSINKIIK